MKSNIVVDIKHKSLNTSSAMSLLRVFIVVLLFFVAISFFTASSVWAEARVSGIALDKRNNPLINSKIIITDSTSHNVVGTATTDGFGNYVLQVPEGTYDITVVPSAESGQPQITQSKVNVSSDMMHEITSDPSLLNKLLSMPIIAILGVVIIFLVFVVYLLFRKK